MKVLYLTNALTHYYNQVLSKLNSDDVELVCVAPYGNNSQLVGDGVSLTKQGINFKVIELQECRPFFLYYTYKGLAKVLNSERPDIVVVLLPYLPAFLFDIRLIYLRKILGFSLVLKDHPFRLGTYQEELKKIKNQIKTFNNFSGWFNKLITCLGVSKLLQRVSLEIRKKSFLIVDCHVNYIDAADILGSYGVNRKKIFVTRNSPDTDVIFSNKTKISNLPKLFSSNRYRLIHVGRLVKWKKVDLLIKAFAEIKKSYHLSELLILGSGPEEATLKNLVVSLNLSHDVHFLGAIYDERLGQCLAESSLYVLAGMGGLSINDAMAYGLPILCSTCDGTERFLVRDGINGRYFKDDDCHDLVDKIAWFFDDLEMTKKMGLESERIIKDEINIHTVIKTYKQAFNFVIDMNAN